VVFIEEDHEFLEMLKRKRKVAGEGKRVLDDASTSASTRSNIASFAHSATRTCDTLALASISTSRSPDWIVDFGASRHVTGAAREFSSYTHLTAPESIQMADDMAQPVIGKGTVQCTDTFTLSNVLHAPSFSVNLLSISAIISQLKCVVLFDIPKVIFQEKETGRRLGTDTWHSGLWYLDRECVDSALSSFLESSGVVGRSVEDLLLLHHRRLGHPSFSALSRLYPPLFEKTNKEN
jgi:hypothetical protein